MIRTGELFEGIDLRGQSLNDINKCKQLYEELINAGKKADFLNEGLDSELDEGLFTALIGGTAGALIGPTIAKALCRILGVNECGTLGKLLTSPLVTAAIGAELAK